MKKSTLIICAIVFVLAIFGVTKYNGMVNGDEKVSQAWANVEAQYQRRADLIPNLVATVKGYAEHEKSTFEAVTDARAKATQVTLNVDELTDENIQKFQQAQAQVSSALSRLLAVSENYPELKASEQFIELQAQLEGTENRINTARTEYNKEVKDYNVMVRSFPGNIFAGIFGFERRAEFKAEAGAEKAPTVAF